MNNLRRTLLTMAFLALAFPLLFSGGASRPTGGFAALPKPVEHKNLKERIEKYAPVTVSYDETVLSAPEKEALSKRVEAAAIR